MDGPPFFDRRKKIMKRKHIFTMFFVVLMLALCLCVPAFAADGDVAGAVEQTWTDASGQIKTVVVAFTIYRTPPISY